MFFFLVLFSLLGCAWVSCCSICCCFACWFCLVVLFFYVHIVLSCWPISSCVVVIMTAFVLFDSFVLFLFRDLRVRVLLFGGAHKRPPTWIIRCHVPCASIPRATSMRFCALCLVSLVLTDFVLCVFRRVGLRFGACICWSPGVGCMFFCTWPCLCSLGKGGFPRAHLRGETRLLS